MNPAFTREDSRRQQVAQVLAQGGWGVAEGSRVQQAYAVTPQGDDSSRYPNQAQVADFVLIYNNANLAVVQLNPENELLDAGLLEAKKYAEKIGVPFAYTSDGSSVDGVDLRDGSRFDRFSEPDEVWRSVFPNPDAWHSRFAQTPFHENASYPQRRYYEERAIQEVLNAIADGQQRMLLKLAIEQDQENMIVLQVVWKLFHSCWNRNQQPQRRPRFLFLEEDGKIYYKMRCLLQDNGERRDEEFVEITQHDECVEDGIFFFTPIEALMKGTEDKPDFCGYQSDFFDFIFIGDKYLYQNVCEENNWHEVMKHFAPAVQLAITRTTNYPKKNEVYEHFGTAVYTYLKSESKQDGFWQPTHDAEGLFGHRYRHYAYMEYQQKKAHRRKGPPSWYEQSATELEQRRALVRAAFEGFNWEGSTLLYPSGCNYRSDFQDFPFDNIIINARGLKDAFGLQRKFSRIGKVFCFRFDNNYLLALLNRLNISVQALAIICDGCSEGGNYECISSTSFLGRFLPLVNQQAEVYFDHGYLGRALQRCLPIKEEPIETIPEYINVLRKHSDPIGEQHGLRLTLNPQEKSATVGKVTVSLYRDSIFRHHYEFDRIYFPERMAREPLYYYMGPLFQHPEKDPEACYRISLALPDILDTQNDPDPKGLFIQKECSNYKQYFTECLEDARANQAERIGFLPFAHGDYEPILEVLEEWSDEFPREVAFFHLYENDYAVMYSRKYFA